MSQEKKRFTFDDEEMKKEEIEDTSLTEEIIPDFMVQPEKEESDIEIEEVLGEKTMKKKKKFKLRIWHVVLALFILVVGGFFVYIYTATNVDGPVYGDRCKTLMEIDDTKFKGVEEQMTALDGVDSTKITKDCRMIEIVMTFDASVTSDVAQELARQTLQNLDIALGQEKENPEDPYSRVFGEANGRGQYNVNFRLRSTGEAPEFPIFGTKQPKSNDISFTKATPKDQATTDSVKQGANPEEGTE